MFANNVFYEFSIILSLAIFLGVIGQKLKQPLIIMFLFAGILAGPSGLQIIQNYSQVDLFAQIGIAILLFIVGLKLDVKLIKSAGPVALATGIGQIVFTSVIGFFISLVLGLDIINAAYVAVGLTFSSTIIIVKLLSDKKEIDSLHGQIAVGFLIVQDIAAILALVALTAFGGEVAAGSSVAQTAVAIAFKGIAFLTVVLFLAKNGLPKLVAKLAYSEELMVLFAIAWAILLSATGEFLGFSKEIGAFLAGISLASTDQRDTIGDRLVTLRDFLLIFFFINMGAHLDWSMVMSQIKNSVILSLFVLVGNPLIVVAIMGFMGYRRRTGFLAGLTVAQISEFSLILVSLGLTLGHILPQTMGLITLVGVVTISVSTYMILYSEYLYNFLSKPLQIFERANPYRESIGDVNLKIEDADIILFGLGKYGSGLAEHLQIHNKKFLAVDFDPLVLEKWKSKGAQVLYGDLTDPELYEQLPLANAGWIVSSTRDKKRNDELLSKLKEHNYSGKIAVAASNSEDALYFQNSGVHVVFRPFIDAAEQAIDTLDQAMDLLPDDIDWPIAFKEVRIQSGSVFTGEVLGNIPLRSLTGVSILAILRAGNIHFELSADFTVYPGDRLVIMGPPEKLKDAEMLLSKLHLTESSSEESTHFKIGQLEFKECPSDSECSLARIKFRQQYGVTVIGIQRDNTKIIMPSPLEVLIPGDRLIVIGTQAAIKKLVAEESRLEATA